jgi:hypothetical protein
MEAHLVRGAILAAAIAALGANYRTANFVVSAPTQAMAEQIGQAAETYRRDLAIEWIGQEMRTWAQPCPITAQVGDQLGAGGATSFVFEHGEVFGWRMSIQGSLVRILDSVLPHEVTHTIFATHFRQPLPRWADEGACTTVEHTSEKAKQQTMLIDFLRTGRGISFSQMFAMKDYPRDVLPLYSQGFSLARYLVAQGGKRKFLDFIADGLRDENWTRAIRQHYGVNNLAELQNKWLDWVRQGSPQIDTPETPPLVAVKAPGPAPGPASGDTGIRLAANDKGASGNAGGPSVYDVAAKAPLTAQAPRGATDDRWHAPSGDATASPAANDLAADTAARDTPQHQVTRPQDVQRPRQVILEWSRPFQSAEDSRGSSAPSGYPVAGTN